MFCHLKQVIFLLMALKTEFNLPLGGSRFPCGGGVLLMAGNHHVNARGSVNVLIFYSQCQGCVPLVFIIWKGKQIGTGFGISIFTPLIRCGQVSVRWQTTDISKPTSQPPATAMATVQVRPLGLNSCDDHDLSRRLSWLVGC